LVAVWPIRDDVQVRAGLSQRFWMIERDPRKRPGAHAGAESADLGERT